ncbi:Nucleolar Complex 2 protein [Exophiala sideris]|uniref:Nucleolar Complex 2 protein n=1 Tax=Exophiala sideris TaxID=1016849 RepID=A0ABR0JF31_9EURO|nr:Nucleolar Complex 2 protein [Exophiala sideris]KAK5063293.1 Nucleolar Complex 2 protein [Exophiala sideris]
MGKQAKATKKFEKNSLKSTIERRKDFAKIKQRHQVKEKKKQRAALRTKTTDDEADSDVEDDQPAAIDMNEDEFFREALDIPEDRAETQSKSDGKRKRNTQEGNHLEQSGLDIEGSDDDDVDHKGQLASLAAKDPEFYKYLQENDADLLDFDEDNDLAEVDDLSDEERPAKKQKTKGTEDDASADVTSDMIERWKTSLAKEFSIRALRQVVLAFRAAAHADDEEDKEYKYTIASPEVYHEVLMTALKQVPVVLAHHLPIKESAGGKFRKFLKVIIKSVASIWSDNSSDKATRITAFLVIRRLMVIGDAGIREAVLKATYEGVVKGSRSTTVHTLAGINLMKNSAAEIWGIDQKVSYTTGFSFIRQLAVHLRGNITKPTKDSYKTIYNWQFVHSLDFWSRVLSTHCDSLVEAQNGKQSQLRPLIYPLVQITLGVMRLIPTSTYFPLRFQLMRSLLRVSQATETYIPLSAALLEVLNSAEMKKPAKAATLRPIDFASNIRAPTSYLKTKVYQEGVGEQVVELFSEFLVLWTKSIAYPELQLPAIVMLKRWLRTASKSTGNRNGKLNQALLLLVQKSEANARWIEERRNKVNFSPKDRAAVEGFLKDVQWQDSPLGAFVVTQRKLREERKKVLDQGRKEQERHNAAQEDSDIEVA